MSKAEFIKSLASWRDRAGEIRIDCPNCESANKITFDPSAVKVDDISEFRCKSCDKVSEWIVNSDGHVGVLSGEHVHILSDNQSPQSTPDNGTSHDVLMSESIASVSKVIEGQLKDIVDTFSKRNEELRQLNHVAAKAEKSVRDRLKKIDKQGTDEFTLLNFEASFEELIKNAGKLLRACNEMRGMLEKTRKSFAADGPDSNTPTTAVAISDVVRSVLSPSMIREFLVEYHSFLNERHDTAPRKRLIERLPELFDHIEVELLNWQNKTIEEGLADETREAIIQVLEIIQTRVKNWQELNGIARLPNKLGDRYDRSRHEKFDTNYTDDESSVDQICKIDRTGYCIKNSHDLEDVDVLRRARVVVFVKRRE